MPQFIPAAGSWQPHMVDVRLEIKILIVDPVRLVNSERNLNQAAAENARTIQARLDQIEISPEFESTPWWPAENDSADMHRGPRRFQVDKRGIYAGKLLHRIASILSRPAHPSRFATDIHKPDPKKLQSECLENSGWLRR